MSEKLMQPVPQRSAETTEKALTPEERADREIAKLDEDMEAILDRQSNREALVNQPNQALQPPQGRSITPGVSAPIPAANFTHLVLNCVVPGLGTLLHGQTGKGAVQLGLAIGALPVLIYVKFWLALLMVVVAFGWSIATGVSFLNTSTSEARSWK